MRPRIASITYHFVPNYGAALQAWALQKCLDGLGLEAFFIDYRPAHLTTGGAFWWPGNRWRLRANLVIAYQKSQAVRQMLRGDGGKRAAFAAFHRQHLRLSEQRYRSAEALRSHPPEADGYVCGSDQIWNSSLQYGIDPSYFLDFETSGKPRVAYAPSFGRAAVAPSAREQTARLAGGLDALSIREESGVKLLQELTGREAFWAPDPTLLPEDGYPEAIRPAQDKVFLFVYALRSRELVSRTESYVRRRLGLDLVSPETLARAQTGAPGPLEWLGYIKNSHFVITNSYHGTLFSIIFQRPFIFAGLGGSKAGFNERARSLLSRLGLENRMIFSYDENTLSRLADEPIDWNSVHARTTAWRAQAAAFLSSSLVEGSPLTSASHGN